MLSVLIPEEGGKPCYGVRPLNHILIDVYYSNKGTFLENPENERRIAF